MPTKMFKIIHIPTAKEVFEYKSYMRQHSGVKNWILFDKGMNETNSTYGLLLFPTYGDAKRYLNKAEYIEIGSDSIQLYWRLGGSLDRTRYENFADILNKATMEIVEHVL